MRSRNRNFFAIALTFVLALSAVMQEPHGALPTTSAASCAVTIVGIEATQSVQYDPRLPQPLEGPVPLVGSRATTVRVYAIDDCPQQADVLLRLRADNGTVLWGPKVSSNGPMEIPRLSGFITRSTEDATFNFDFILPNPLLYSHSTPYPYVVFEAIAGSPPSPGDWEIPEMVLPATFPWRFFFGPRILGMPMDCVGPLDGGECGPPHGTPAPEQIAEGHAENLILAAWPWPNVQYHVWSGRPFRCPYDLGYQTEDWGRILRDLAEWRLNGQPRYDYVYGFFKGKPWGGQYGGANLPGSRVGYGPTGGLYSPRRGFTHEVAHELGGIRSDDYGGGIDEVGWDVKNLMHSGRPKPEGNTSIMGAFGGADEETWAKALDYRTIMDNQAYLVAGWPIPTPTPYPAVPPPSAPTWLVSARREGDPPSWALDYAMEVRTAPSVPEPSAVGRGQIRIVDGAGVLLYETAFEVAEQETGTTLAAVLVETPVFTDAQSVELLWDGCLEDVMARSPNAPQVTITSPQPGNALDENTMITWNATDADGGELRAAVVYCDQEGQTVPLGLALDGAGGQFVLSPSHLPASDNALIRISVTDGLNTTVAEVVGLVLGPNRHPAARIVYPEDGDVYRAGAGVALRASVFDPEDLWLQGDSLSWYSSLDGFLGNGEWLNSDLSPGVHVIQLTASDSDLAEASDTVVVEVVAD